MKYKITGDYKPIVAKIKSLDIKKCWIVTIEPAMSDDQRKLYFKFIDAYSNYSGIHQLELHDLFKSHYLPIFSDLILISKSGSIKELDSKEFIDFMEKCRQHALGENFVWE